MQRGNAELLLTGCSLYYERRCAERRKTTNYQLSTCAAYAELNRPLIISELPPGKRHIFTSLNHSKVSQLECLLYPLHLPSQGSDSVFSRSTAQCSVQRRCNTPCPADYRTLDSVSFHSLPKLCEGLYYFFRPLFLTPAPSFSGGYMLTVTV